MSGWERVALGDLAESVDYGVTASATQQPSGPKFLRITDIQDGAVNWESVPWCECDAHSTSGSRLEPGDIVFARTGATTGKSYLIRDCPADAVFASYLIRVRLGAETEPRYVSHFFQTPDYWTQIARSARGVAQPGVNATTLKALKLPVPPLPEQRRIAEVLDRAEALRAKRRAALAQLDTLTQAIFLDMFGNPATNSRKPPYGQTGETVADVCAPRPYACVGGPFGSELTQADYIEFPGVPVIRGHNLATDGPFLCEDHFVYVSEAKARQLRKNIALPGDVVVSQRGARLAGQVAYIPQTSLFQEYVVSQSQMKISPDATRVHPFYLVYYFRLPQTVRKMEARMISTGVPHINLRILREFPVMVPPLAAQCEFARRVAAIEKLKATHRASLAELDALFASLQQRAFRGEL